MVEPDAKGIRLRRHDPAAGTHDPAHLADRRVRIVEVHQDALDMGGVEGSILERQ